jgi:hypothetical protein
MVPVTAAFVRLEVDNSEVLRTLLTTLKMHCNDRLALAKFFEANPENCKQLCSCANDYEFSIGTDLIELCASVDNNAKFQEYLAAVKALMELKIPSYAMEVDLIELCTGDEGKEYLAAVKALMDLQVSGDAVTASLVELCAGDAGGEYLAAVKALIQKEIPGDTITADLVKLCAGNGGKKYLSAAEELRRNGSRFKLTNHMVRLVRVKFAAKSDAATKTLESLGISEKVTAAEWEELIELCASDEKCLVAARALVAMGVSGRGITAEFVRYGADYSEIFESLQEALAGLEGDAEKAFFANPEMCIELCGLANSCKIKITAELAKSYANAKLEVLRLLRDAVCFNCGSDQGTKARLITYFGNNPARCGQLCKLTYEHKLTITKDLVELCDKNPEAFEALQLAMNECCRRDQGMKAELIAYFGKNPARCGQLCKLAHEHKLTITKELMELCDKNPEAFEALQLAMNKCCGSDQGMKAELIAYFGKNPARCGQLCKLAYKHKLTITKELVELCDKNPEAFEALQSAMNECCGSDQGAKAELIAYFGKNLAGCEQLCKLAYEHRLTITKELVEWCGNNPETFKALQSDMNNNKEYLAAWRELIERGVEGITVNLVKDYVNRVGSIRSGLIQKKDWHKGDKAPAIPEPASVATPEPPEAPAIPEPASEPPEPTSVATPEPPEALAIPDPASKPTEPASVETPEPPEATAVPDSTSKPPKSTVAQKLQQLGGEVSEKASQFGKDVSKKASQFGEKVARLLRK